MCIRDRAADYEKLQSSVSSAAARGYVDLIIDPADTRKYLVGAFEMLYTKYVDWLLYTSGSAECAPG